MEMKMKKDKYYDGPGGVFYLPQADVIMCLTLLECVRPTKENIYYAETEFTATPFMWIDLTITGPMIRLGDL